MIIRKALAVVTENRSFMDFETAAVAHLRGNLVVVGRNSDSRFALFAGGTYLTRLGEVGPIARPQAVGWTLGQRNPTGINVADATLMPIAGVKRYSVVEDRFILDGAHRYRTGTGGVKWREFLQDPNNGFYCWQENQLRLTRKLESIKVYYSQQLQRNVEKREAAGRLTDEVVNILKQRHLETGTSYEALLAAMEEEEENEVQPEDSSEE